MKLSPSGERHHAALDRNRLCGEGHKGPGSSVRPRNSWRPRTDPIVEEVRRIRDAHAAMFNYDLDAIFQDIKEQEKKSGLKFVSYQPRRTEPNRALQRMAPLRLLSALLLAP